jgi:hypothetical protein
MLLCLLLSPVLAFAGVLDDTARVESYINLAGLVVLVASAAANALHSKKGGTYTRNAGRVVDFLALNWKDIYSSWKKK